ncbi:MAG: hypothetical protein Pars2KO_29630 [Parasphingorhabdus sp.]
MEDRALIAHGCDQDPLAAAGVSAHENADNPLQIIALISSKEAVVRWHDIPEGATEKQALSAVILEAKTQSLNPDDLHVAAAQEGEIFTTATLATGTLVSGLTHLQSLGIDPDCIVPAGFLLGGLEGRTVAADFGFDQVLRGPRLIAVDEPLVRNHLVSSASVENLSQVEMESAITSVSASMGPNLRTGQFVKKTKRQLSAEQKKMLIWLVAALLLTSIAIPLVQLYKYHSSADEADEAAMAAATKVIGPAEDLAVAEQQLDEKLLAENLGNNRFTVPASSLFSALQQVPGVSISRISYGGNGLLSVELTAVRNEDINPALIVIQDQGYAVTATPRRDASGLAKADVTVRLP